MSKTSASTLILSVACLCSAARAADLTLADSGRSDYRIVIAVDAGPSTKYAAKELQSFLKQISDAELPIVTAREPATGHEIILGANSHWKSIGRYYDLDEFHLG